MRADKTTHQLELMLKSRRQMIRVVHTAHGSNCLLFERIHKKTQDHPLTCLFLCLIIHSHKVKKIYRQEITCHLSDTQESLPTVSPSMFS